MKAIKQPRLLARSYVNLMLKLGLMRFSILLAIVIIILAITAQVAITTLLQGRIERIDILRSLFFGLLITPWAIYFLSVVVEQQEISRQRLKRLVDKLKEEMARREKTQIELEQKSSFLKSFLDASPDLVFYRNIHAQFSGCNRAMEILTGKRESELIGLTPRDVYSKEIAEKISASDQKIFLHNASVTYEQWLKYPDGHKACFEIRKVPYYDHLGKSAGLMGFGRDITERKRYQSALEKASREKTTFISTISHELRTPLNGIVGLSHLLLDTHLDHEQVKYLKTIHTSAITLGNIFNDVIEMDNIEQRNLRINKQPIDLKSFIDDINNLATLLAQPKKLQFILEPDPDLPTHIIADDTRLRQILWNLISNAVKFTPKGTVKLRINYEQGDLLHLEVEDSGPGIPAEEQSHIFSMYYQVKDKLGRKPAVGTGIGLAVSRHLAQAMGGDIHVNSILGQGACFTVNILAPQVKEPRPQAPTKVDSSMPVLNVLLVEDIELNILVARSVLKNMGHHVVVAMTGKTALDLFSPDKFHLVLLDIQLPDMTGLQVSKAILTRFPNQPLPPLVAVTANLLKDKKAYLDAGIDYVLSKPLHPSALTEMIKKLWSDKHEKKAQHKEQSNERYPERLNLTMLEEYVKLTGFTVIRQGLNIFENAMPQYLVRLRASLRLKNQADIVDEGHKIKGAAGSLGLHQLQQLAEKIQNPASPNWEEQVEFWVNELDRTWQKDVELLKLWTIGKEEKNSPADTGVRELCANTRGNG